MKIENVIITHSLPTGVCFGVTLDDKFEQVYFPSVLFKGEEDCVGKEFRAMLAPNDHPSANRTEGKQTPWKAIQIFPRTPPEPIEENKDEMHPTPPVCIDPEENDLDDHIAVKNALRSRSIQTTAEIVEASGIDRGSRLASATFARNHLERLLRNGGVGMLKTYTRRNSKRASEVFWTSDPNLISKVVNRWRVPPK